MENRLDENLVIYHHQWGMMKECVWIMKVWEIMEGFLWTMKKRKLI